MNEEKVKNLLLFFAENITSLPITKAMKLLFYADFVCFAETGASITGLDYHAWDQGPVPPTVYRRIDKGRFDCIHLEKVGRSHLVKPVAGFKADLAVFSAAEREIIERVRREGRDVAAGVLSEQTHRELPWTKTELYGKISYEWAPLQAVVMKGSDTPADDEIIMDIIERNPALQHCFEAGLEDWFEPTASNDLDHLLDDNEMTPVHWEKGIGWVEGR
jgi:uncharacterized phage-associated protein